jgi:hypothetical protein
MGIAPKINLAHAWSITKNVTLIIMLCWLSQLWPLCRLSWRPKEYLNKLSYFLFFHSIILLSETDTSTPLIIYTTFNNLELWS